ncbi:MAG: hypothetical protein AAGC55_12890, partial [Myxococcota bacterium]
MSRISAIVAAVCATWSVWTGPVWAQTAGDQAAPDDGQAGAAEPAAAQADTAQALPDIEAEAQGTCLTPRQAYAQLLFWLQKNQRWSPTKAAACLDTSRLDNPTAEAPERAEMLKLALDSRSARIDLDALPTNPDYRDNNTGRHVYWDPVVRAEFGRSVYLVKDEQLGQWL